MRGHTFKAEYGIIEWFYMWINFKIYKIFIGKPLLADFLFKEINFKFFKNYSINLFIFNQYGKSGTG